MTIKYILGQLGENGKPKTIEVEEGVATPTEKVATIPTNFAFKASDMGLTGPQIVELYSTLTQTIEECGARHRNEIEQVKLDFIARWEHPDSELPLEHEVKSETLYHLETIAAKYITSEVSE